MLSFTLYLLFALIIVSLFYLHFRKRANEIHDDLDMYAREATSLAEDGDGLSWSLFERDLEEYGRNFCVNRPWFGVYAHYQQVLSDARTKKAQRDIVRKTKVKKAVAEGGTV